MSVADVAWGKMWIFWLFVEVRVLFVLQHVVQTEVDQQDVVMWFGGVVVVKDVRRSAKT